MEMDPLTTLQLMQLTFTYVGDGAYHAETQSHQIRLELNIYNYPEEGILRIYRNGDLLGFLDHWPRKWHVVGWLHKLRRLTYLQLRVFRS